MSVTFEAWVGACAARTEAALEHALPSAAAAPQRLHAAMRHAVLGGGKRVRPLVVYAAGEAFGGEPAALDRAAVATSPSRVKPSR